MKKKLTKQDFLTAGSCRKKTVEVPGLDGLVNIREITVEERAIVHGKIYVYDDKGKLKISTANVFDAQISLIALAVVDDEGKPIFTPDELKNISATQQKAIDYLFAECDKVNGVTCDGEGAIEKN